MWWNRSDGTLARGLPRTRRIMPYMMRGRTESATSMIMEMDLAHSDAFIRKWNQANPGLRIDIFHLAVWGLRETFTRVPSINRFVAGGRIYDRKGIWFSYAVKQKLETGSPLFVVKRRFDTDGSFGEMVEGMAKTQAAHKDGSRPHVERELGLLFIFPGFIRRLLMAGVRGLDRVGMLPRSYIENDPMYCSAFFANLASLGLPAITHHLYEYGTCGAFCVIGRPTTAAGSPTSGPDRRRTMEVSFTFDERADDGLAACYALRRFKQIIEDPEGSGLTVTTIPGGVLNGDSSEVEAANLARADLPEQINEPS